jgi:hypothetical protein
MKKVLFLIFIFVSTASFAQTLVSYNLIKSYTTNQIDSILASNGIPVIAFAITYDINIYHVVYNTLDADSLPIIASGALMVPINPPCKVPLASYQHGTITVKTEVPSTLDDLEVLIGETLASDGCAVCMPDGLGLGDSPGLHPYVHAQTEARATADMLVVALQILDELAIARNGQLFLTGYSQGGHSTMAAHQLIQQAYTSYFTVTASTPMSGPYDLSGVQADLISSNNSYPTPGYLPYLLLAYNSVYHIYANNSDFLVAPYDSILPPLFDGTHELSEVDAAMPPIPNQIIVPAVLDSFNNDSTYRLRNYLKLNDTYNWTPLNPVRMFYCEADMDVNYQNAFVAYDHFIANGCTLISKMSSGMNLDHSGCVFPSLLNSKFFFDSLRLDKIKLDFELHPASSPTASDGSIIVHAHSGFPPYTYLWNNGITDSVNANLPPGLYSVTVTDATGCGSTTTTYLSVQVGIDEVFAQQTTISPNPMLTITSIQFPVEGKYTLDISDASGRKILHDEFFGSKYVLLRKNLSSGIYLFRMQKEDGLPFIKMIVVE